jgi:hypothetical protein
MDLKKFLQGLINDNFFAPLGKWTVALKAVKDLALT